MIGFIILIFLAILLFYILYRLYKYLKNNTNYSKILTSLIGILFYSGLIISVISFFLSDNSSLKRLFSRIGYYWLGAILYLFIGFVIVVIIRFIFKIILKENYNKIIANKISSIFIIAFTLIMNVYGIYNAHNLHVTKYQLVSDKNVNDMHIVFISDLHLGYNVGLIEIEDMVETINKLKPDIVLIGGDIFDNEFGSIEEPEMMSNLLSSIDSKYGVFTCLGNHDVDEKIFYGFTFKQENVSISDEMLDFLAKSNIKLLYEDYICVGDYIIYGRPDYERINLNNNSIKSISNALCNIDKDKYLIVLDHEPRFMNEYSNNNVDLLLNGHTHNGQIWPGTITIKLFWDNCYGYKKYQDMDNIVSSGVGLYGVNMRIGTIAEICDIYISSN